MMLLVTADNERFEVDLEIAKQSALLESMFEGQIVLSSLDPFNEFTLV